MDTNDIRTLYAYNRWANRRMFSVLEKLSAEQFSTAIQSSFPSVRESVFHILAAEWIWLKRWKGTSPRATRPVANLSSETWSVLRAADVAPPQELSTLAALRAFGDDVEKERAEFLRTLSDDVLRAPLNFSDMLGTPYSEPLFHLMQHVVNHGTYHRGQVTTLLRQLGAEAVALDMVYFFRDEQAASAD